MRLAAGLCMAIAGAAVAGAGLHAPKVSVNPNTLGRAPVTSWPTFNGDYSGERYSTLTQIGPANLNRLVAKWVYRITDVGAQRGAPVPVIKCTPLMVDGVLYMTIPDHVWALDARTGKERWRYDWVDHGGHLVGQRGVGIWKSSVFFETPDNWLIALDANTGKELWRKNYADARKQYFSTSAPLIVKNHVIVGVGGDAMDMPGFLDSFDPATGELQWTWWSTPRKGDAALKTWPDEAASDHGGGMTWMPGTYDAALNLLYWPTGNTNPVFAGQGRPGANLWTESIVALDADTGKLKWYFQVSPHDTHDFDNTTAPILFDRMVNGKREKLLAQAARNGFFVTLDRVTGKYLVVKPYVPLDYRVGIVAGGRADSDSRQGSFGGRLHQHCERVELAGAVVQPEDRAGVCELGGGQGDLLPDRRQRQAFRLRRHGRGHRAAGAGAAGHRSADRKSRVEARVSEPERRANHSGAEHPDHRERSAHLR